MPQLNECFTTATAGFSGSADDQMNNLSTSSMKNQFLGGMLLGSVWSPCVGLLLVVQFRWLAKVKIYLGYFLIMLTFAIGVSSVILVLGYGTGEAIRSRQHKLRGLAEKAKPIMGITFLLVGLMISSKIHHHIEACLLDVLPFWLQDLSVKF